MKAYLINTETLEFPIYEGDFRLMFPNVSFPSNFTPSDPYAWVMDSDMPEYDINSQSLIETQPVIDENGTWVRAWNIVEFTVEQLAERKEQLNAQAENQRAEAYRLESDPLFFKSQRGEATVEEWLAKIEEIKTRYPKI